ncbi:hemagglutinin repeat-containing protein [Stenotrophomonas maltophilia]|uniref:hemagglutinin repeat-containing protein n=1 Tax=Stenotrophomonas maltophilia TaxID=40324 RepID=UPI00244CF0F3|nr:hemagglutinin repeat-containing protein [Stenotrophomonas maltophilia]MDH0074928.1 hemagglutinin repeat-containing protein [Stenotrophomonas maltophilia]
MRDLQVQGTGVDNRAGQLNVQRTLAVRGQRLDNRDGTLDAAGALQLQLQALDNRSGRIGHSGDAATTLDVAGTLDNRGGRIASNAAALALNAGVVVNADGKLLHAGSQGLTVSADSVQGRKGEIATTGTLQLTAGSIDHRQAQLQATQLKINAQSLDNSGGTVIASGDLANVINATTLVNEGGTLASNGDLALAATTLDNRAGQIQHAGTGLLQIDAQRLNGQGGSIIGNGSLQLRGELTDLSNGTTSAKRISVNTGQLDTRHGSLTATGTDALQLQARELLRNDGGQISANGVLDVQVGRLSNQQGKLLSAADGASRVVVTGAADNRGGTLASAGALQLQAASLDNRGGTVQAAGNSALTVSVDGALDNGGKGLLAGGGAVTLKAGSVDNRDGSVSAGDALDAQLDGTLDNRGGTVAANQDVTLGVGALLNGEGGTLASVKHDLRIDSLGGIDNNGGAMQAAGQLQLQAASLANRAGTLAAADVRLDTRQGTLDNSFGVIASTSGGLDILSGRLLNDAGLIQASTALSIDTHGQQLLNTNAGTRGGILAGGSAQLRAGALDNQAGLVHAQGALDARLASLDNRSAGQFGSNAGLELHAQRLDNRGGTVQAGQDARLRLDNELLNQGGLVVASGTLDASAGSIDNRDTQGGSAARGLQGNSVLLAAGQVDNRNGIVAADQQLRIDSTGDLLNAGGLVSSAGTVQVNVATLGNRGGTLLSGGNQNLGVARLDGTGRVLSQGELVLTLQQGHVNDGEITANGKASITSGGTWTNIGSVQAGDLTLHARDIDNTASGKISGISTHVIADATLTNRGVIDGVKTRIDAATVDNVGTGRIYGDQLSIQAGTLINREETVDGTTRAATLAARERLDLGVGTLVNREHALIFSAGGSDQALNIGGALDANGYAIGRAGSVHNASAILESLGGLAINTGSLLNSNEHFATAEVLVQGPKQILYIQPKGDANKYDSGSFVWSSWSRAGKYRWKDDPPPNETGVLGQSPVPRVGEQSCVDGAGGEEVCTRVPGADYLSNDPAWAYFGVQAPDPAPVKPQLTDPGIDGDTTKFDAALKDWQARHDQWEAQTDARYVALDNKIDAYNDMFGGRDIKEWTQFDVTRTVYETQVTRSDPGKILAGGRMQLNGDSLVNDKSQILAGGALTGDLGNLRNVDAFGEHRVHEEGTSQYTYSRWRGGFKRYHERKWDDKIAYRPADEVRTINLDITKTLGNTRGNGSGYQVGGRDTGNVGGQVGGAAGAGTGGNQRQVTEVSAAVDSLTGPGGSQGSTANGSPQHLPTSVRTVAADTELPTSSLFRTGPNAGQYLVETDPQFADYRSWLGSDYLLQKMGFDPAATQKRLGDGFYEQKLVREQIAQLTGRRFLDGYASDEAQYRALLDNAATLAEAWDLRPGVALTAAQMAQLTSDIVWLVEQTVTLPDGSTQTALVPQVYVRVRPGDLDGRGTLLAGQTLNLNLRGDLVNSGTLAGRAAVQINAENLRNLNGRITGDAVNLKARTDLDNLGGLIDARSVLVASAGRDMNVLTTTRSGSNTAGQSDFSRTNIDRVAGLFVSDGAGTLLASAGRDINLNGAQVVNAGTGGQTAIVAGRDLNLGTVTESLQENNVRNADNYLRGGYSREVGTRVDTTGSVQLQAGNNLDLRAAQVHSTDGGIAVVAGNDVSIGVGEQRNTWAEGRKHTQRGLLGSTTTTTRDSLEQTQANGSTLSGNQVGIRGNNVTVTGSQVVSDAGTVILADNNLTIQAATNTSSESHFKRKDQRGLLYNGGVAFTAGSQMQSQDAKDVRTTASASTVGSTHGNVVLAAGNDYRQVGSHVVALDGDVDIQARRVDIVEARQSGVTSEESKFRQSGLTVALSAPVISALQSAEQIKRASSQTSDGRVKALAAASTAMSAASAVGAVQADPKAAGGINISITVGGSRSDSKTTTRSDTAAGSSVTAGGDVRITATGAGNDSDITVVGSNIRAGNNAILRADGDIALLAAKNSTETDRKSSGASGGVGVAVSLGSGGAAFGVTANASQSKGRGEGTDTTWTNTHVDAGNALVLQSGGDTTLRGAVASGRQVVADVGGNLKIESLQDTSVFHSKDTSVGGSVTVGMGFSGSASYANTKVDGDFASVVEQSGIKAGDGGYQVRVGGNTDLIGGVIASSAQAIAEGSNQLITSTLSVRDLENRSDYKASSLSLSGGFSRSSADKAPEAANSGRGNDGTPGAGGAASQGSSWGWQNFGSDGSLSAPGYASDTGSDASTTRSGISAGSVVITDAQSQVARTGKSINETLAGLNRDVLSGDDANGIARNWDPIALAQKVQAEAQISAAFTDQAYGAVQSYTANRRDSLAEQLKEAKTPEDVAAVNAQIGELRTQEKMLNILIGAVTGSAGSAVGKEALASAADWMRAEMIKNSQVFAGVVDPANPVIIRDPDPNNPTVKDPTVLDNIGGISVGVDGDGYKLGGTRVDLDKLCGSTNERCVTNPDNSLKLDAQGYVQWDMKKAEMSLADFLKTPDGLKMAGLTGGIQGIQGTLAKKPYAAGGWQDQLIEHFAGPHDMIGGQLAGLYDAQGNARRDRGTAVSTFHEGWTVVAIPVAAPFAMAKGLPPGVWQAITQLIKAAP